MRNTIPILVILMIAASCGRKAVPQTASITIKDSVVIKDSVIYRDSVISIPGERVVISDSLDFIKEDAQPFVDSFIYKKSVKKGNLTASVKITNKGKISVECNMDSLLQRINWLEHRLYTFQSKTTDKTILIPGPIVEVPHTPKWIKYYIGITLAFFAWYFRSPLASGGKYVFSFIKRIISNG